MDNEITMDSVMREYYDFKNDARYPERTIYLTASNTNTIGASGWTLTTQKTPPIFKSLVEGK